MGKIPYNWIGLRLFRYRDLVVGGRYSNHNAVDIFLHVELQHKWEVAAHSSKSLGERLLRASDDVDDQDAVRGRERVA